MSDADIAQSLSDVKIILHRMSDALQVNMGRLHLIEENLDDLGAQLVLLRLSVDQLVARLPSVS